ncbi:3731_t:CDS:1, partial [Funneliformis mosseae]
MGRIHRRRFFCGASTKLAQRQREHIRNLESEVADQKDEAQKLRKQLSTAVSLIVESGNEIQFLVEDLERLSGLPSELNKWYEKYNTVRNKLETSNKNLEGYKSQNKNLAHRLEQVQ